MSLCHCLCLGRRRGRCRCPRRRRCRSSRRFGFPLYVAVVVVVALVHPLPARPASNFTPRTNRWLLGWLLSALSLSGSFLLSPCSFSVLLAPGSLLLSPLSLLSPAAPAATATAASGLPQLQLVCSRSAGKTRARNDCSLYTEHCGRSTTCFQPASCVEFFPKPNGMRESERESACYCALCTVTGIIDSLFSISQMPYDLRSPVCVGCSTSASESFVPAGHFPSSTRIWVIPFSCHQLWLH